MIKNIWENFGHDNVKAIIKAIKRSHQYSPLQADQFLEREMDIVFSRGYGEIAYTTVIFCVKGSPNKLYGWIDTIQHPISWGEIFRIKTNLGTYYSNGWDVCKRPDAAILQNKYI